ncbi:hypothetical protein F7R91_00475 [Streptomyces luteolifulvus]|jgi:hypothetical protein|uniref:Nuclear transport factor 2 family protein n=1 Tax=Streptomyces luteolifulvus TaxID=2615112 RepID=A0A6H9V9N2_9ACTN|nr:hypothetical protein [Streptomyces luteolifulvus]KAB1150511.1 hypothetical protein F7R91_00475 [Streptomyces luteolifulvus]
MSWTRGLLAALAVCVLLLAGSAGCGTGNEHEQQNGKNGKSGVSPSPVGKILEDKDNEGRRYREVDEQDAPEVGIEVEPDARAGWDVRLTVRNFRFSPAGTKAKAVAGRGVALLFVDGRPVAGLRTPEYHLSAGFVPHGTHHVTARLYADDHTVWAVDGEPVESTADITASESEPSADGTGAGTTATSGGSSVPGARPRTEGRGSPDRGGKAS